MSKITDELLHLAAYHDDPHLVDVANRVRKLETLVDSIGSVLNPLTYGEAISGYHGMFNRIDKLVEEYRGN